MKTKIVLSMLLSELVLGGYIPTPAPVPMGDFIVYQGETRKGWFSIDDPNGPEGLTISCSPPGLIISEPNIYPVERFPEAKKYVYPYTFTPVKTGIHVFEITSVDSAGVTVTNQIKYTVKGNAPHVFTGCREGIYQSSGQTNKAWDKYDTQWQLLSPKVTNGNIYVMQMRSNESGRGVETNIYRQD